MKYGLAELPEEKDIPELYRKMLKEGIVWGCNWIKGFLEKVLQDFVWIAKDISLRNIGIQECYAPAFLNSNIP